MAKRQAILLLASYCGDENPECSDERPCIECLKMCNIAYAQLYNLAVIGGWEHQDVQTVHSSSASKEQKS